MKKVIQLFAVLILLMTTASVEAKSETFHVYAIGDKKFNVQASNIQGKAISYVKNDKGEIFFERKLKGEELNITFNLTNLSDGNYWFVIEDELKRKSAPFTISSNDVEVNMKESTRVNFPQLVENDDFVLVRLLSDESNDLSIDIRSEYGQLLFHDELKGKVGLIGKKIKFEPGDYLVTLNSSGYTETRYLSFK